MKKGCRELVRRLSQVCHAKMSECTQVIKVHCWAEVEAPLYTNVLFTGRRPRVLLGNDNRLRTNQR